MWSLPVFFLYSLNNRQSEFSLLVYNMRYKILCQEWEEKKSNSNRSTFLVEKDKRCEHLKELMASSQYQKILRSPVNEIWFTSPKNTTKQVPKNPWESGQYLTDVPNGRMARLAWFKETEPIWTGLHSIWKTQILLLKICLI